MKGKKIHSPLLKRFDHWLVEIDPQISSKSILIGTSGGADSTCLLTLFSQTIGPEQLLAIYINHGLRAESEIDKEISQLHSTCKALGVKLLIKKEDVPGLIQSSSMSTEEAARYLRHACLEQTRATHHCDYVALGHNYDDQIEEFFLRIIRGSGLSGLSGMLPKNGRLIRPLLKEKKEDLQQYLQDQNILHSTDSTNSDEKLLRNNIRLNLLPLLKKQFNPAIDKSVSHLQEIFVEEDAYLSQACEEWIQGHVMFTQKGNSSDQHACTIPINAFNTLHLAIRRRVVEKTLNQLETTPSFSTVTSIVEMVQDGKKGDELHLKKGLRVIRNKDDILFSFPLGRHGHRLNMVQSRPIDETEIPALGEYDIGESGYILSLQISGTREISPNWLQLDAGKISFPLLLRPPLAGEKFVPFGFPGSKKINRFYAERKIDKTFPRLCLIQPEGNRVIALVGVEISDQFKTTSSTKKFLSLSMRKKY